MKLTPKQLVEIATKSVPEVEWRTFKNDPEYDWKGYDLVNKDHKYENSDNHYFQISFTGKCTYFDSRLEEYDKGHVTDYL